MAPSALNESTKEAAGVPSGFILKLYQMVNGAPDEVISVSPCNFRFGKTNESNLFAFPTSSRALSG